MKKLVERNVAEIVFITIITLVMMSSCGVQFGDYERYREVHGKKTCHIQETKPKPCIKSYCVTLELNEIKNTSEDMIEWINSDIENKEISKSSGESYISNLNEIVNEIIKLKNN